MTCLEDALRNTELIVHWSNDPDTTRSQYGAGALWRLWLRERGIKQIFIDPFCNYTAVIHGDKWIPIRPNTGAALALAIMHVWIEENTYDHDYVAKRTVGFEEFKRSVTGGRDGVPKTPEWAAEITGIKARVIRALAREWASKRTMLGAGGDGSMGGACREAYGHEWARLMVLLVAMQGMGKPGVNMWGTTVGGPLDMSFDFPGYSRLGTERPVQKRHPPEEPGNAGPVEASYPRSGFGAAAALQERGVSRALHRGAVYPPYLSRAPASPRSRCSTGTAA